MKKLLFSLLLSLTVGLTTVTLAAGMPTMEVTVSDASGKVAFKGKTAANGTFSTRQLPPGTYVVQFNSRGGAPKGNYALVVSAGKQKVVAEAVAGSKFAAGGVAMKVNVGKGLNITGQVSSGNLVAAAATSSNAKVKVVNGKRYVWVTGETGTNVGGRWVEEGSAEARNVSRMSTDAFQRRQDHGDAHQEGFPGVSSVPGRN